VEKDLVENQYLRCKYEDHREKIRTIFSRTRKGNVIVFDMKLPCESKILTTLYILKAYWVEVMWGQNFKIGLATM